MNKLLDKYLTYAGPCQWDEGWLMTFNFFGVMQVSIIENSYTKGTELHIFDLRGVEPQLILNRKNITPELADIYMTLIYWFWMSERRLA